MRRFDSISKLLRGCALLALLALLAAPAVLEAAATPRELLATGRADEAIRVLRPMAAGNNAEAYNLLGRVYYQLGNWNDAVRNCERAAQLNPQSAEYQIWLARAYGEKANAAGALSAFGLARKSVAAFETAHRLDPRNLAIARDLGEYYVSAPAIVGGGLDKASSLAQEMTPVSPALASWIYAMAASKQGNQAEAERRYEEAVRYDHESAETLLNLARYYRGRKQPERFDDAVRRALQSRHLRPEDRFDAAEQMLRMGRNLPEAAQQVRLYLQSGHPSEDAPVFRAHTVLGDLLSKSGDTNGAANEYRAALALASGFRPAAEGLRRLEKH